MVPRGEKIEVSEMNLLRYGRMVTPLLATLMLAGSATAATFLPPAGKIFAGVADKPVSAYTAAVGKHPAVYQEFLAWGQWLPGITADATTAHARMMMEISTSYGGIEAITPQGIADGAGDAWLIGLNQAIYASHNITYVRLMAEMNNYNNPYSADNANGSSRGPSHSPAEFKLAWKRTTLILRGGSLAHINSVLKRLGLPRLRATANLPRPKVSMLWVPMVGSNAGPGPAAYWPGKAWVDWVGTDFYSKFPNWSGLNGFYSQFNGKPFVFGEYALWGQDSPSFINQLFVWARSHARVRMLIYNQGAATDGPFRLRRYPAGAAALRHQLASSRFPAYAPEWKP
jgi:hypothetical protein